MEQRQRDGGMLDGGAGPEGFRGPQVCKAVGITYRQLDYWARTDLLRPSISDARGSGTQRVYSYTDLLQLKVIKQLLDAGVSLRSTRKAIECLRASGASVASASLVIADDRSVLAHSGAELFDLLHGGQGVLSIVLGMDKIVSEVEAAITELRGTRSRSEAEAPLAQATAVRTSALG
jgi:DNA-binding transcriptional MerR regulator